MSTVEEVVRVADADGRGAADVADAPAWSLARRIAFRVACVYLVLYNFDQISGVVPGLDGLYGAVWQRIVPWVGAHVLRLGTPITYFPSGSGDKTSDWVQVFCFLATAAIAALIWSIVDRRRTAYRRLHDWLRVYVRYALAFTMIGYGVVKVIKLQFPDPSLTRLVEPLGEFSPMGLLWTFMGYSKAYTFFGGAAEMTAALLLLFRRTTTLGALIMAAVMLNVAMMNFAYDVPVKQFSSHLCLMALFLTLPDVRRLVDFFLLNRPVPAAEPRELFTRPWPRRAAVAVKMLAIGAVLFESLTNALASRTLYGELAPRPPIYGIYEVEALTRNGTVVPPLLTESRRWRKVIFPSTRALAIRTVDDTVLQFSAKYDAGTRTIALSAPPPQLFISAPGTPPPSETLSWTQDDAIHVTLQGSLNRDTYVAKLRRIDESAFRLVTRGFHWVSEYPFNR